MTQVRPWQASALAASLAATLLAGCTGGDGRSQVITQEGALRFGIPEGTTTVSICTPVQPDETVVGMADMAENTGTQDIRVTSVELVNVKGLEPEEQLIRKVGGLGLETWTSHDLKDPETAAVVDPLAPLNTFTLKPGETAIVAVKTKLLDAAKGGTADQLVVTYQEVGNQTQYVVKGNVSYEWREGEC